MTAALPEHLHYIRTSRSKLDLRPFPNLLVLGPQRTGTTWLFEQLRAHPQIFMSSPKELYFFNALKGREAPYYYRPPRAQDEPTDLAFYLEFFRQGPRALLRRNLSSLRQHGERYRPVVRGEASAHYAVLDPDLIAEIVSLQPELKAILMIRDPIARAWSHAKKDLVRNAGRSMESVPDKDFYAFFEGAYQRSCADYQRMIEQWSEHLQPGNLFIGMHRSVARQPETFVREVLSFLGVRSDARYIDAAAIGQRVNPTDATRIPQQFRDFLTELFAEELRYLEAKYPAALAG